MIMTFSIVFVLAGCTSCQENNVESSKYLNFILDDSNGGKFDFSTLKGKVVVVDFWDTWCPPCKAEIPGFVKLKEKYKDKDFEIVGVALGREGKNAVKKFASDYKINYPVVIKNNDILRTYPPFRGIPTTFILNKKGEIVKTFSGLASEEQFENAIKPLLQ